MKKEYKGTDGTAGFISAWESESKEFFKQKIESANYRAASEFRF